MPKRVYIFGRTTPANESTIGFATMILNVPYVLPHDINIDLNTDVVTAFNNFMKSDFNVFFCMPTTMSGLDFLRKAVEKDNCACIIGRYVVPKIDWEAFEKGETLVKYNVRDVEGDWPELPQPMEKLPEVFVIHKEHLPFLPQTPVKYDHQLTEYLNACKPVVLNNSTVSVFGKHVFKGAVGLRNVVR